jgi:hypothetical protein
MTWWSKSGSDTPEAPAQAPGESVYERRALPTVDDGQGDDQGWVRIAEIDPTTGQLMPVMQDWQREASGCRPVEEYLRSRGRW